MNAGQLRPNHHPTRVVVVNSNITKTTRLPRVPEGGAGVPEGRAAVPEGGAAVPEGGAAVPEGRAGVPEGGAGVPLNPRSFRCPSELRSDNANFGSLYWWI